MNILTFVGVLIKLQNARCNDRDPQPVFLLHLERTSCIPTEHKATKSANGAASYILICKFLEQTGGRKSPNRMTADT